MSLETSKKTFYDKHGELVRTVHLDTPKGRAAMKPIHEAGDTYGFRVGVFSVEAGANNIVVARAYDSNDFDGFLEVGAEFWDSWSRNRASARQRAAVIRNFPEHHYHDELLAEVAAEENWFAQHSPTR